MKITILGSGAYAIAMSKILKQDNEIFLWSKFEDEIITLKKDNENISCLPGFKLDNVTLTSDLKYALNNSSIVIVAIPASAVDNVIHEASKYITNQVICLTTKGMDNNLTIADIVNKYLTCNLCILSGPTIAKDMASNSTVGITLAGKNDICEYIKNNINTTNIDIDITNDIKGVEISSSIKNIFAVIMGMVDMYSDSTKASMFTVLFNDFKVICELLGSNKDSIYLYSGIGDLFLTCTSTNSRNYLFGKCYINSIEKTLDKLNVTTVEGVYTLKSIYNILNDKKIKIKSIDILYNIVYNNLDKNNILRIIK
ncbi:MAG: NAD(P)H-dependent glycerol-3-phosphate dehydrogenase [Clostridia bacterium]